MDASDILENKLTQLQSLLSCCYGDGGEWFDAIGTAHRDNIMWIAADLSDDIIGFTQELLKRLHALEQPKAEKSTVGIATQMQSSWLDRNHRTGWQSGAE